MKSVRKNFSKTVVKILIFNTLTLVLERTKADIVFTSNWFTAIYGGQQRTTFVRLTGHFLSVFNWLNLLYINYLTFRMSAFVRLFFLITFCISVTYKKNAKIFWDTLCFYRVGLKQTL